MGGIEDTSTTKWDDLIWIIRKYVSSPDNINKVTSGHTKERSFLAHHSGKFYFLHLDDLFHPMKYVFLHALSPIIISPVVSCSQGRPLSWPLERRGEAISRKEIEIITIWLEGLQFWIVLIDLIFNCYTSHASHGRRWFFTLIHKIPSQNYLAGRALIDVDWLMTYFLMFQIILTSLFKCFKLYTVLYHCISITLISRFILMILFNYFIMIIFTPNKHDSLWLQDRSRDISLKW